MQSGLPGNMLKIFAAMTMLLDHAALTVVYVLLEKHPDYWKLVTSTESTTEQLNAILHNYGKFIIGRMGVPYREKNINIVSIALDAPQDIISSMSGKIGKLQGVSVKTAYSNVITNE